MFGRRQNTGVVSLNTERTAPRAAGNRPAPSAPETPPETPPEAAPKAAPPPETPPEAVPPPDAPSPDVPAAGAQSARDDVMETVIDRAQALIAKKTDRDK